MQIDIFEELLHLPADFAEQEIHIRALRQRILDEEAEISIPNDRRSYLNEALYQKMGYFLTCIGTPTENNSPETVDTLRRQLEPLYKFYWLWQFYNDVVKPFQTYMQEQTAGQNDLTSIVLQGYAADDPQGTLLKTGNLHELDPGQITESFTDTVRYTETSMVGQQCLWIHKLKEALLDIYYRYLRHEQTPVHELPLTYIETVRINAQTYQPAGNPLGQFFMKKGVSSANQSTPSATELNQRLSNRIR